mmetsp:Transcript_1637/g.2768  ORF Transcript_1637/g.2768 Transcript_1637/m.2768 type:complete len:933 (-) Transcript_1637:81-2879(-)
MDPRSQDEEHARSVVGERKASRMEVADRNASIAYSRLNGFVIPPFYHSVSAHRTGTGTRNNAMVATAIHSRLAWNKVGSIGVYGLKRAVDLPRSGLRLSMHDSFEAVAGLMHMSRYTNKQRQLSAASSRLHSNRSSLIRHVQALEKEELVGQNQQSQRQGYGSSSTTTVDAGEINAAGTSERSGKRLGMKVSAEVSEARVKEAERILQSVAGRNPRKSREATSASSAKTAENESFASPSSSSSSSSASTSTSTTTRAAKSSATPKRSSSPSSSMLTRSTAETSKKRRTLGMDAEEEVIRYELLRRPVTRYSSDDAKEYFQERAFEVWERRIKIAVPLMRFVATVVVDYQAGRELERRPARAREFLEIITSLGPAFIKAGQALSSRPDLLPPEYLKELQKLQDRLPPFENEVAFALIESELGRNLDDVFESIEPTPYAAASIGQVYKAYLKTGEQVAIKVQRPNCEDIVAVDILILRQISGVLSSMLKVIRRDLDLRSVIDEFGKLLYEEIDYIKEADNATRFMDLYGHLERIRVPKIYWKYTSRKILTMEWIDGLRLTSDKLDNRAQLVRTMVQCSLRQMLEEGFFHADPHGGNLLACPDGRLCYLDFGMMSEVDATQRYGIIEAVVHLVNRDFPSLARLYVRLGFLPKDTNLEPIIDALNDALPDVLTASVSELNFKSVIDKLGTVFYRYPFSLPPYYTAILRCLGVLEGLAIQVDPSFRIINDAYPYIAGKLLIDDAPELQDAMEYLLFSNGKARWDRLESLLESAADSNAYDVTAALNRMIEFLLSQRGEPLRYSLTDDLVDELDTLSTDIARYTVGLAVQSAETMRESTGIPVFPRWILPKVPAPVETQTMLNASKLFNALRRSQGFDPQRMSPVLQKFLARPEGQRIAVEVGVNLAERLSSKAIRTFFGLSDKKPSSPSATKQQSSD